MRSIDRIYNEDVCKIESGQPDRTSHLAWQRLSIDDVAHIANVFDQQHIQEDSISVIRVENVESDMANVHNVLCSKYDYCRDLPDIPHWTAKKKITSTTFDSFPPELLIKL